MSVGTTSTFKWETENRVESVAINTSQRSIMQQGWYINDPEIFPTYHNDQYYLVPDTPSNNEKTPHPYSSLPEFSVGFAARDTTNTEQDVEPEEQVVDSRICPICNKAASTSPIGPHPSLPHLITCSTCDSLYWACDEWYIKTDETSAPRTLMVVTKIKVIKRRIFGKKVA